VIEDLSRKLESPPTSKKRKKAMNSKILALKTNLFCAGSVMGTKKEVANESKYEIDI
jgi:hypothetical protein